MKIKNGRLFEKEIRKLILEHEMDDKFMYAQLRDCDRDPLFDPRDRPFAIFDGYGGLIGFVVYQDEDNRIASYFEACNFSNDVFTFGRALYRIIDDCFYKYNYDVISWGVVVGNNAEKSYDKLCDRVGGRIIGTERKRVKIRNNVYDYKLYEILREDYRQTRHKNFTEKYEESEKTMSETKSETVVGYKQLINNLPYLNAKVDHDGKIVIPGHPIHGETEPVKEPKPTVEVISESKPVYVEMTPDRTFMIDGRKYCFLASHTDTEPDNQGFKLLLQVPAGLTILNKNYFTKLEETHIYRLCKEMETHFHSLGLASVKVGLYDPIIEFSARYTSFPKNEGAAIYDDTKNILCCLDKGGNLSEWWTGYFPNVGRDAIRSTGYIVKTDAKLYQVDSERFSQFRPVITISPMDLAKAISGKITRKEPDELEFGKHCYAVGPYILYSVNDIGPKRIMYWRVGCTPFIVMNPGVTYDKTNVMTKDTNYDSLCNTVKHTILSNSGIKELHITPISDHMVPKELYPCYSDGGNVYSGNSKEYHVMFDENTTTTSGPNMYPVVYLPDSYVAAMKDGMGPYGTVALW